VAECKARAVISPDRLFMENVAMGLSEGYGATNNPVSPFI
jgi:hypothetical protein